MLGRCIKCGRALEAGRSVGPLCLDCYLETRRLICLPARVEFDYCKQCGSIRVSHTWLPGGEPGEAAVRYLERVVASSKPCDPAVQSFRLVSIEPLTRPSWRTVLRVVIEAVIRGVDVPVSQSYNVEVYARPTLCPACKDARGGDYNVLLQLRGAKPAELAKRLEGLLNASEQVLGSIVDVIEYSNGVDIMLLDRGSASKIVRELRKWYRLRVRVTGEDVGVTSRGRLRRRTVMSVSLVSPRRRGGRVA